MGIHHGLFIDCANFVSKPLTSLCFCKTKLSIFWANSIITKQLTAKMAEVVDDEYLSDRDFVDRRV